MAPVLAPPSHTLDTAALAAPVIGPRQATTTTTVIIPANYGALSSSPSPGTVVGIVLGSIAGFAILLAIIYSFLNVGVVEISDDGTSYGTASVISRRSRRHHHRRSSRAPGPRVRATETVEVRTRERRSSAGGGAGRPIIVDAVPSERGERIIFEERRTTSRGPPPRVVMESDDEIIVEEEGSPRPRRQSTRRSSRRRS